MKFVPLKEWGWKLNRHGLLVIAGPCSAENREQVRETACGLAKVEGVSLYRAGVWKPRTHPGTFEGRGEAAFPWLTAARQETGLGVLVEVANGRHVEQALAHGVDGVWLGARTTVTPFAVQEIADALEGRDVPVLVKNPVSPDLELWIGALERLYRSGIRRLGAIWRGVRTLGPCKYRNAPMWSLPLELRSRLQGIPCLCDPSHIGGRRDVIGELCQQALHLAFDGLMIESHCHPDEALSDSRQQVSPAALGEMLSRLHWLHGEHGSEAVVGRLSALRAELDQLDMNLLELLCRRMSLSRELGVLKKSDCMTVFQRNRWEEVLGRALSRGRELGLQEAFVRKVFEDIHAESITQQL